MKNQPTGFTPHDFYSFERDEYDRQAVKERETGGYDVITDAVFGLFELSSDIDSGSDKALFYKSGHDGIQAQCELKRIDSELYDVIGFQATETTFDVAYGVEQQGLRREVIDIVVSKSTYGDTDATSTAYTIEHYPSAQRVVARVSYPDVAYNTYGSRDMTPYDEAQLIDELLAMHNYIAVQQHENNTLKRFA